MLYRVGDLARRIGQVGLVAVRYGFGHVVEQLDLLSWLPRRRRQAETVEAESAGLPDAVRLRLALAELGPTFIKLGQMLSTRPDLLPAEYVDELRKLQDDAPPVPVEEIKSVIQREFGRSTDELFRTFEEEPAASASIGQVHYAQLHTGEQVAVKVQRPGVERLVETDLAVLQRVAAEGERRIEWCRRMGLVDLAQEFGQRLKTELNFTNEAHNTERLSRNASEHTGVRVPAVYWPVTTSRVLTLERVEGLRVADAAGLREAQVRGSDCAATLVRAMLRQIFVDGYFHGDPHHGNLFVAPPADIVFLDCGSVGWLGHESRDDLAQLLTSALRDDAAGVCDALLHLGVAPPETDLQALRTDIDGLLARYGGAAKDELRIGDVLRELMRLVFRYEIRLASEMALVLKALILTDSVCLALDPEFNFREAAEPLAHELGPALRSPKELVDDLVQLAADLRRYMTALPRQISRLLTRAEQGNLKVKVEYDEIDRPLNRLDIIANRLSFSVVVSAIILASALLLQAESPLMVRGFPLPGVIGLGLGSLMGLWLLYSILRSGRL